MNWLTKFADKQIQIENAILRARLELAQSEFSEPFTKGFSQGLEMSLKLLPSLDKKVVEQIRTRAIEETLERLNGNNKKIN